MAQVEAITKLPKVTLPEARNIKEYQPKQASADDLGESSDSDQLAASENLFEVDLQPDHEEKQQKSDLWNRFDRCMTGDQSCARWPDHKTRYKIREY